MAFCRPYEIPFGLELKMKLRYVLILSLASVALLALALFLITKYVQPVLPQSINSDLLLAGAAMLGAATFVAALKDVVELTERIIGRFRALASSDARMDALWDSKIEYRRDRVRRWREAVETFDFRNESFGGTVWYSELRPHLQEGIVKKIEAPRTDIVPAPKRGESAEKHTLLDEIARIERDWDLI
jgi:hypothetical protein